MQGRWATRSLLDSGASRSGDRISVRGAGGARGRSRLEGPAPAASLGPERSDGEIVHQIETLGRVDAEDVEPVDMERVRAEEDEFAVAATEVSQVWFRDRYCPSFDFGETSGRVWCSGSGRTAPLRKIKGPDDV